MEHLTFYKGAALDKTTFCAAAYFDAQETPDEPGTDTALVTFSLDVGWSQVELADNRVTDVAVATLATKPEAFALSERGALFDFQGPTPRYDLTPLAKTPLRALAAMQDGLTIVGDHGTYLRISVRDGPTVLTDRFEMGDLDNDATLEEEDAYFANERYVMAAAANAEADLAVVELTGASVLSPALERQDLIVPQNLVGVTVAREDQSFLFCGHNPRPAVFRLLPTGQFLPLYYGTPQQHTLTHLAVHMGDIYLADTALTQGGLYVLSPEDQNSQNYEFNLVELPAEMGRQPVWRVESMDDVLWVLRSKDILRLESGTWQQFIPDL